MQEDRIWLQWSKKILLEYNWFIHNLQLLIYRIKQNGDLIQETKDMVAPGSIMEFPDYDYKIIRSEYLKQRKRLKNQLAPIKKLL